MEHLNAQIQALTQSFAGELHVGLHIQTSEQTVALNADQQFVAASTMKLAVYLYYLRQVQAGQIDLASEIVLASEDFVGGAGCLSLFPQKRRWQVVELLQAMIAVSDNTATNVLIRHVGLDNLQQLSAEFPGLVIARFMMEPSTQQNYITASTAASLLKAIYDVNDEWVMKPFLQQQFREGLCGLLDEKAIPGLFLYNKTGRLDGFEHDVAIFRYQNQVVTVAAFSQDLTGRGLGIMWLRAVGAAVFAAMRLKDE
ncbi:MAG: serine hydrolase [Enterococcus sp.]